ncbi:unnamed protein product (macronuclear) [Paramecium tetraurelia]|uniref:E3 ubiquitin-protein ligase RNF170 n=1 Tax=Paramecium tetraurelia TaxID=5888 RepID=A0C852_PARTE|nr:uncharacterized protein GSPATT00036100001 [Paramecium tetraurelia]CAK66969.1 unnamed protein product [Paramecium tetraurelia]|eukprot:XP_001434366.1 hypothetical protein (macronuclear) [Paramecium tetraurelia strain d4-2]
MINSYRKWQGFVTEKHSLKNLYAKAKVDITQIAKQIIFTILIAQIQIETNQSCPICLNEDIVSSGVQSEQCKHTFCIACINIYWQHNQKKQLKCPCCRAKISTFAKSKKLQNEFQQECDQFILEYRIRCTVLKYYLIYPFQIIVNVYKHLGQLFNLSKILLKLSIQLQLVLCFILCIYVLSPIDLFPEAIFGVLGLVDDLLCIIFIVWIIITQIMIRIFF